MIVNLKRLVFPFLVAGVTMVASCTKAEVEEPVSQPSEGHVIEFFVDEIGGRTVFGESTDDGKSYPTLWQKDASGRGEQIKVNMNLNFTAAGKRELLKDPATGNNPRVKGEGVATSFAVRVTDDGANDFCFYAVSPATGWKEGDDESGKASLLRMEIPAVQTPIPPTEASDGSCDPSAQLIFAKTNPTTVLPESLSMRFQHVAAYGLLSLKGLSEEDAPTLVRISSSQPIAGRFYYNAEDGTITRNTSGLQYHIALHVQSASSIWFAAAPTDLSNTALWITVVAANGNVWVKKLDLGENRALKSGRIAKLTVALSEEDLVNAGSIYYENGEPVGVVYRNTMTERRIVSAKRMNATYWASDKSKTGASSKTDGKSNTETLREFVKKNSGVKIPMLEFCDALGEGWYWPAHSELQGVSAAYHGVASVSDISGKYNSSSNPGPKPFDAKFPVAERKAQLAFDALLLSAGGDVMNEQGPDAYETRYWTSSEHDTSTTTGRHLWFGTYHYGNTTKNTNNYFGRAIKVILKDPSELPTRTSDLRYAPTRQGVTAGSTSDRLLDLYLPATEAPAGGYPVFLFVHGGGFGGGDKYEASKADGGSNAKICMEMAARGFVAISINYYLGLKNDSSTSCTAEMSGGLPANGAFSDTLQTAINEASVDAALALKWVKDNAATYKFNVDRVAVSGGSAGAITVLDLAYFSTQTECPIHAVVALWGGVADPSKIQTAPPTLMYHGTEDPTVNHAYSEAIAARLQQLGVPVNFQSLEGKKHAAYDYIINNRMDEIANFLNGLE